MPTPTPVQMMELIKSVIPPDCLAVNVYERTSATKTYTETSVAFHSSLLQASRACMAAHIRGDRVWCYSRETTADEWRGYTELKAADRT